MGQGVHVHELPGIGKRFDIDVGRDNPRLSVVVRRDGGRDLYIMGADGDDPAAVVELDDDQARKVAAVLTGTFFQA